MRKKPSTKQIHGEKVERTLVVRRANIIQPKGRSGSCWTASKLRIASLICVAERVLPRASITQLV